LKKSPNRDAAEALVNATIAHFLSTLDPSVAVAVHEHRSELRHAELIARLDASKSFEDRLLLLPGPMRDLLGSETVHRATAERVVDALVRGDPTTVIANWCDQRPDWLGAAPSSIIAALGFGAIAYGLRSQASRLFEEAADLGLDPARWYARAALEAAAADEMPAGQH